MIRLEARREGLQLWRADALELCAAQAPASVDLICCDPPYYRVKDEEWDRQWRTEAEFLAWIGELCEAWRRILKPNGSLYVFASPDLATRVEMEVRGRFNLLNSIRWVKDAGWHQKAEREALRSYLSPWEAVLFAEQWGTDERADEWAGYGEACHLLHQQVFAPLGRYIRQERERAGLTRGEVEVALGYVSRTDPTRGTALCYRWEEGSSLPTAETYERLRELLNRQPGGDFLRREYEDLRREYEDLRREYEDLRREYEDLRRPFQASPDTEHCDLWDFPTVDPYPGKHPCEKPAALLEHIIQVSSRPGDLVFDCCMGSGSTGEAALRLGRQFIGGDNSAHWSEYALARLERRFGAMPQTAGRTVRRPQIKGQVTLEFAEATA